MLCRFFLPKTKKYNIHVQVVSSFPRQTSETFVLAANFVNPPVMLLFCFWQISSVRDITKSSIEDVSRSSSSRRLLKLGLTDGHTEITAIEFAPVPSVPDDLVPGAKVVSFLFASYLFISLK